MYSDAITLIRVLLGGQANGLGVRVLAEACGLLRDSCRKPKLSRRDADDPLEVKRKMALVCEAGPERNLRQAELAVSLQELLRSVNAARDQILVRRGIGFEIFHDVLNDRAEFPSGSTPPAETGCRRRPECEWRWARKVQT
jgi:hypothetical protein